MRKLSLDIETYSSRALDKVGVYAYSEAPDFTILLLGYAWEDEPAQVIDLIGGEPLPEEIRKALEDEQVIKYAYNASFERICLSRYLKTDLPISQWRCSAVHGAMLGLPRSLEGVSKVLGLGEDEAKSQTGKALIGYFCKPCKPTRANGQRTRNYPHHDAIKWKAFKDYCKQDVVAERALRKRFERWPIPEKEQKLWELDQKINDRGIGLDRPLIEAIMTYHEGKQAQKFLLAQRLTGLSNPNSPKQLTWWLGTKGIVTNTLDQQTLARLLNETSGEVHQVLRLRQEMSKTSMKKYEAMARAMSEGDRLRGCLQFYGASRSGRWAGKLVQVHNLPQNKMADIEWARTLVSKGHLDMIEGLWGRTSEVFSQLIRTMMIPKAGCKFIVADFSAIEARIIAWLAGETWRLEVFASHGKIYEASAGRMFGVPLEAVDKAMRQKGKIAELACGYGGGVGALMAMGAGEMGLGETDLERLIEEWREANPRIVALWKKCEEAVRKAIRTGWEQPIGKGVVVGYERGKLWIQLPSRRKLMYEEVRLEGRQITYEGLLVSKQWGRISTYGGKLVENIVQAIARDCLAEAMMGLEERGFEIVLHVHDEVVVEVEETRAGAREEIGRIMERKLEWADGLEMMVESFEGRFYRKE